MGKSQAIGIDDLIDEAFEPTIVEKPQASPTGGIDDLIDEAFGTPVVQPRITPSVVPKPVQQPQQQIPVAMNEWGFEQPVGISTEEPGLTPAMPVLDLLDEPYGGFQRMRKEGLANLISLYRKGKGSLPSVGRFTQAIELIRKDTGKDYVNVPADTYWDKFMRAGGIIRDSDINLTKDLRIQLNSLYMNGKIPPPDVIRERLGDELGNQVIAHMEELSGGKFTSKDASWRWRGENKNALTAEELMAHPELSSLFNVALDTAGVSLLNFTLDEASNPTQWVLDYSVGKLVLVPAFKALSKAGFMRKPITRLLKTGKYNPIKIRNILLDDLYRSRVGNDVIDQVMNMSDDQLMNIAERIKSGTPVFMQLPKERIGEIKGWKDIIPTKEAQDLQDLIKREFQRPAKPASQGFETSFPEPISIEKQPISVLADREAVSGTVPMPRTRATVPGRIINQQTTGSPRVGQEFVPGEAVGKEAIEMPPAFAPERKMLIQRPKPKPSEMPSMPLPDTEEFISPLDISKRPIVTQADVNKILANHDEEIQSAIKDTAKRMYQDGKDAYRQAGDLYKEIMTKTRPGISPSEKAYYENIPSYLIRKGGKHLDEFAQEQGFEGGASEAYARILQMDEARKALKDRKLTDYIPDAERFVMSAEKPPEIPDITPIDTRQVISDIGQRSQIPGEAITGTGKLPAFETIQPSDIVGAKRPEITTPAIGNRIKQASTGFEGIITNIDDAGYNVTMDNGIKMKFPIDDVVVPARPVIPTSQLARQTRYTEDDIVFMRSQGMTDADIISKAQAEFSPEITGVKQGPQTSIKPVQGPPYIQPETEVPIMPGAPDTILPKQTISMERGIVPEPELRVGISTPKDKTLLKSLGFDDNKINALSPEDATRIAQKGISADDVFIDRDGTVVDKTPPQGNLDRYEKLTEGDFIEDGPPIGLGIRRVIPAGVEVYKPPKDLKGLSGWFENWIAPVRAIADKNPIANRIAHSARDTVENMAIEISHFMNRIDDAYKKIPKKEWPIISQYMEKKLDPANIPLKLKATYDELSQVRSELYDIIVHQMGIDTSKWQIPLDAYWPHVFVGDYQIKLNGKTIPGGFANTLNRALDIVEEYMRANPGATGFEIAPKEILSDVSTTMLSRRGYYKLINNISNAIEDATTLGNDEIMGLMKGVAAIKPRPKFVGNFMERISNLGGYIEGPDAIKIYTSRVLRKKYIDPFQKNASDLATQLPPGLKEYFEDYIKTISGKFDPKSNSYFMRKILPKVTSVEARMKLGYRPVTAIVNRLQPTQLAYGEIGQYLWRGWFFKHSPDGKKLLEASGIYGEMPQYSGAGYISKIPGKRGWKEYFSPLGMFAKAEIANREDVISGGYLFAQKVFRMDRAKAEKMGYKYILDYLDAAGDPKVAALQYAKDLNADVNFIFSNADLPKIMRGPIGKTALQFKAYPINFLATTTKWTAEALKHPTPHNMARMGRFLASNALLGGVRSVPYAGRAAWRALIMSSLTLPFMAGLSGENRNYAKEVLGRGLFSLLGIDMSRRLGPNEFMPKETKDFLGPLAGDIYNIYQFVQGDKDWKALLGSMPMAKDVYMAFGELGAEQLGIAEAPDFIADPNKRMRKITEIAGWDRAFRALGLPIEKVEITKDISAIAAEISKDYSKNKAKYVDRFIAGLSGAESKKAMQAWTDALNNGIFISFEDIFTEASTKNNPQLIRMLKNMPVPTRMEYLDLVGKGQSVTDLLYKKSGIKK